MILAHLEHSEGMNPAKYLEDERAWLCDLDTDDEIEVLVESAPDGVPEALLERARKIYTHRDALAEEARRYITSFVPPSSFEKTPNWELVRLRVCNSVSNKKQDLVISLYTWADICGDWSVEFTDTSDRFCPIGFSRKNC